MTSTSIQQETQATFYALRRIVQAIRESSRWAERHIGVSNPQLFVLQKLADTPFTSLAELATRTHTHPDTMSTVVSRLVMIGLVKRSGAGPDANSITLRLSAKGRHTIADAPDVPQIRLTQAIQQLSPARRRQLASTLGEVALAIDCSNGMPEMFFEDRGRQRRAREVK